MMHRRWIRRFRDLVAPGARDREMRDELQFHIDAIEREYRDAGLSADAARRAARRRFGSLPVIKDRGHDVRGGGRLEAIGRELRHAARRLRRSPTFAATSALTLALAIGANVAIFAVVHRVVVSPLPYPESDRLLLLDHANPRINMLSGIGMTPGLFYQYLDRSHTLESVAMYQTAERTLAGRGEPERIRVALATTTLVAVLGVQPALGRWFTEAESAPGGPSAAVLSHGLWMRRYGGDPRVLGRSISLNGVPTDVVGVMPARFAFPDDRVGLWLVDQTSRAAGFSLPFGRRGVARLRNGATPADARAEIDDLIADLPRVYPGDRGVLGNVGEGGLRSAAIPLKDAIVGRVADTLWILLASVGLVLLVACANIANLFLVRSEARQREVAVRRALGAGVGGIAGHFFAESALLSIAGGAGGLGLAWATVRLLVRVGPASLPRLGEVRLDTAAVALACGLTTLAAVTFGVIPLLRGIPASALQEGGRSHMVSRGRHRLRRALMGGQVALALVLLVASGLMVRSFQHMRAVNLGFDPASALTFRVGLPERDYPTRRAATAAHERLLDGLAALPGVRAVAAASGVPLAEACFDNTVLVRGRPRSGDPNQRPNVDWCAISDGYLQAMGMRLVGGRPIDRADVEGGRPVALVNRAFATILFPEADPIGEWIRTNAPPTSAIRPDGYGGWTWDGAPEWLEVVGVVDNTPARALTEPRPMPSVFIPMSISGGPDIPAIQMLGPNVASLTYVIRSASDAEALPSAVRRVVDGIDPNLAVAEVRTLQDVVDAASAQMAFTMVLLAIASGVALLLGLVGIYGVVSYIVSQRTNEIGVRLALGAAPHAIVGMIVGQGGAVAFAGIAAGLAAALAGGRLIESTLYGVTPRDPAVLLGTTLGLFAVAILACWLPARRAARIDPAQALRHE